MYGKFELILVDSGRRGALYTVQFADQNQTELDLFLTNPAFQAEKHFQPLVSFMGDMLNRHGFQENFFKHQGYFDEVLGYQKRISGKREHPSLRLYVIRWSNDLLIAGAGCIKKGGGRLADYSGCPEAHARLLYAYKLMKEKFEEKVFGVDLNHSRFTGTHLFGGE